MAKKNFVHSSVSLLTLPFIPFGLCSQVYLRLGEKEIDYNPNFRLYITTKLANPRFSPETSVKTTIINFAVKEQSLQAQLLTLVVQKERPDLDKQKNELILQVRHLKYLDLSSKK